MPWPRPCGTGGTDEGLPSSGQCVVVYTAKTSLNATRDTCAVCWPGSRYCRSSGDKFLPLIRTPPDVALNIFRESSKLEVSSLIIVLISLFCTVDSALGVLTMDSLGQHKKMIRRRGLPPRNSR